MAIAIVLVVTVGSLAYLTSREPPPPGRENLLNLSILDHDAELVLATSERADIESYLQETFGIQVRLPLVRDASITGAGAMAVREGISIPTIEFSDPNGDIERLLVFTYSMLDRWESALYLDRTVRLELEDDRSFAVLSTEDGREVILWRSGDDIYLTVARNGAGGLIARIAS